MVHTKDGGYGANPTGGTGDKAFTVTISNNAFQEGSCIYAEYTDKSNKSNTVCFKKKEDSAARESTIRLIADLSACCVSNAKISYTVKSDKGFNKTGTLSPTDSSTSSVDIPVPVGANYTITGSVSSHTCKQNNCAFSWKEFDPGKINIPMLNAKDSYTSKAVFGCDGCSAASCVSASNNTTVTLDKSPTVDHSITIWPVFYLQKALDDYVEFEVACNFKNLSSGQIEEHHATVGIEAGRTAPSSTVAAVRGSGGICYQQLTPCTVYAIKPSSVKEKICQPVQETTSMAPLPQGCSTSPANKYTLTLKSEVDGLSNTAGYSCSRDEMVNLYGAGQYDEGEYAVATTEWNSSCVIQGSNKPKFDGWYNGSSKVGSNKKYSIKMVKDTTLTAKWTASKPAPSYSIRVWARDEATSTASSPVFVPCASATVTNGPLPEEVCFEIIGTLTCSNDSSIYDTHTGMKHCFTESMDTCPGWSGPGTSSQGSGSIGFANIPCGNSPKTVNFSYKIVE